MFDSIARKELSVCVDSAGFRWWLDDAEVNARNVYLAHKNPAGDGMIPAMDTESGQTWLEPEEAELLADKREYENLKYLEARFPSRKRLWLERYALEGQPNQPLPVSSRPQEICLWTMIGVGKNPPRNSIKIRATAILSAVARLEERLPGKTQHTRVC